MSEEIKLSREVEAIAIPAGTTKKLAAGTEVNIVTGKQIGRAHV